MPQFKAVLFDLDGTLINSEYFHFSCWNDLLRQYNVQLTFTDWQSTYAGNVIQVNAKRIKEQYQLPLPLDELVRRRMELSLQSLRTHNIELMPYAGEMLEWLQQRGIILALVTSSQRDEVEAIFGRNGLAHYFKVMVTRDDVHIPKPDPEGYTQACERLGLQKHECLVFEDSRTGLQAAKDAGLTCYGIQQNATEHEHLRAADQLFLTLEDARNYLLAQRLI